MLDLNAYRPEAFADRPVRQALMDGWKGKCPNCHHGKMFHSYLKVEPECMVCGEELHHQRADDGPAYLTILVCGHVIAPLIHLVFVWFRPDPLALGVSFALLFIAMALYLLPRFKGGMIALQWARRMHGFGHEAHQESAP
ncbi:MAG: DUF983 domain-containing protein [Pseudomonadota bacterium]